MARALALILALALPASAQQRMVVADTTSVAGGVLAGADRYHLVQFLPDGELVVAGRGRITVGTVRSPVERWTRTIYEGVNTVPFFVPTPYGILVHDGLDAVLTLSRWTGEEVGRRDSIPEASAKLKRLLPTGEFRRFPPAMIPAARGDLEAVAYPDGQVRISDVHLGTLGAARFPPHELEALQFDAGGRLWVTLLRGGRFEQHVLAEDGTTLFITHLNGFLDALGNDVLLSLGAEVALVRLGVDTRLVS